MATGAVDKPLPGTIPPRRFVPRFHYELLVCGTRGHELVGTDARDLRPEDGVVAFEREGQRWHRCLRCDSWLPLPPPAEPSRDALPAREDIELPLRGKPLRDRIVLRIIAVDRALHFLVLAALGLAILAVAKRQGHFRHVLADVQRAVGGGPFESSGKEGLFGKLDHALSLDAGHLHLFAAVALAYAAVEGIEAIGLWYEKRWAEYLTLLVTASLLPLEVSELLHTVTPFKVIAFVINVAVVLYLLLAKRLFGLRGGARTLEAERREDMGWRALEAASPG